MNAVTCLFTISLLILFSLGKVISMEEGYQSEKNQKISINAPIEFDFAIHLGCCKDIKTPLHKLLTINKTDKENFLKHISLTPILYSDAEEVIYKISMKDYSSIDDAFINLTNAMYSDEICFAKVDEDAKSREYHSISDIIVVKSNDKYEIFAIAHWNSSLININEVNENSLLESLKIIIRFTKNQNKIRGRESYNRWDSDPQRKIIDRLCYDEYGIQIMDLSYKQKEALMSQGEVYSFFDRFKRNFSQEYENKNKNLQYLINTINDVRKKLSTFFLCYYGSGMHLSDYSGSIIHMEKILRHPYNGSAFTFEKGRIKRNNNTQSSGNVALKNYDVIGTAKQYMREVDALLLNIKEKGLSINSVHEIRIRQMKSNITELEEIYEIQKDISGTIQQYEILINQADGLLPKLPKEFCEALKELPQETWSAEVPRFERRQSNLYTPFSTEFLTKWSKELLKIFDKDFLERTERKFFLLLSEKTKELIQSDI